MDLKFKIECYPNKNVMLNLFQHLKIMRCRNKFGMTFHRAFTLAEVLITLTIIGVIAAITIPNLMQSYKKHQVEAGIKEAYSILSNAIKMSETENGSTHDWDYQSHAIYSHSKFVAETYIFPYLKTTKICGFNRDSNGECFSTKNGKYGIKSLKGGLGGGYTDSYYSAVLANGMSIGIYSNYFCNEIAIDIDGPNKGESIVGKDVFYFYTTKDTRHPSLGIGLAADSWPHIVYLKAYKLEDLLGSSVSGSCNKEAPASAHIISGINCSAAIAKNGWRIPGDYPVKKW